jgi:hypothetical protein
VVGLAVELLAEAEAKAVALVPRGRVAVCIVEQFVQG